MSDEWPVALRGLTESIVTTPKPDDGWALAALGLRPGDHVTARTWGRTRTRRNFERAGGGVVQFTRDPVAFVEAALAVKTLDEPVLDGIDARVEVTVERLTAGQDGGTEWVDWRLHPEEISVVSEAVPTIERGFNAVVEATVAASRLDVASYDEAALRDRLARHRAIVDRCGSARDRAAMARLDELIGD